MRHMGKTYFRDWVISNELPEYFTICFVLFCWLFFFCSIHQISPFLSQLYLDENKGDFIYFFVKQHLTRWGQ